MAAIIVPWRHSPERARVWRHLKGRYRNRFPDWPICVCGTSGGEWVKADSVMPTIARFDPEEVMVVADADVWSDSVESTVRAVTCGVAEWGVPHKTVHRLSAAGTEGFMAHRSPHDLELERRPYPARVGGGIVIAQAKTLTAAPLDPRFVGWGFEDGAWGLALQTLAGTPYEAPTELWHLWHPPQEGAGRRGPGLGLFQRYRAAQGRRERMRNLLGEIDECRNRPNDDQLHDHSPIGHRDGR